MITEAAISVVISNEMHNIRYPLISVLRYKLLSKIVRTAYIVI